MVRKTILSMIMAGISFVGVSAASILDIKHSITNDDIVPPESFETKTRELEENFFLRKYIDTNFDKDTPMTGTDEEYEKLLATLPVEMEMPYNSIVGKFINMYLGKRRRLVSDMLALHNYYGPIFLNALAKEGLPHELQYLPVIESAINPNAVSRAGAAGLWQFMPSTATGLGLEVNSLVDQRRDPVMSSRQAARYLKQLHDIYEDWSLAIAAYNCGPGRVNQAIRRAGGGKKDFWEIYRFLPSETRDYIPAFIAANFVMNFYDKYGVRPTIVKRPLTTETVEVKDRLHFKQIADVIGMPIEEIRMLNPQFRKDIIPGDYHPYQLTLPIMKCMNFDLSLDQIKNYEADSFASRRHVEPGESRVKQTDESVAEAGADGADGVAPGSEINNIVRKTHIVGRGENLRDIAKKYGVSATDIKHWNKLRRGKVKEGDELLIEVVERKAAASDVPYPKKADKKQQTVPMPKDRKASQAGDDNYRDADNQSGNTSRKRYSTGDNNSSKSRKDKSTSARTNTDRSRSQAASKNANKSKQSAKQAKPKDHKVAKGESLEKIAKKNGVTVDELRKANGMKKDATVIREGQNLKIPAKKSASVKNSKKAKNTKAAKNSKNSKSSKRRN